LSQDISPPSLGELDEEAGSEQIEDIDESPPRRVSSTQALRALSRSPLVDDGTHWTTVSAPPDGSASVASNGFSSSGGSSSEDLEIDPGLRTRLGESPAATKGNSEEESQTPSDDEMLDMPPLRRQSASPKSMLSPITSPSKLDAKDYEFIEDDHEDVFHFDENLDPKSPPALPEEEEEDEPPTESPTSPTTKPVELSSYSMSPVREVIRPSPPRKTSSTAMGVVGSYKGRPFSMPIVTPEIHAQAASLGALNSFVGSLNGRTGLDESDQQSFRASGVGSFSGTPRSMSERLMLDDIMEAEEAKRKGS